MHSKITPSQIAAAHAFDTNHDGRLEREEQIRIIEYLLKQKELAAGAFPFLGKHDEAEELKHASAPSLQNHYTPDANELAVLWPNGVEPLQASDFEQIALLYRRTGENISENKGHKSLSFRWKSFENLAVFNIELDKNWAINLPGAIAQKFSNSK